MKFRRTLEGRWGAARGAGDAVMERGGTTRAWPSRRRVVIGVAIALGASALPPAALGHSIWLNPGPRAGSLPTDEAAPCGGRPQAAPGTSPSVFQPGATIGVFFREDVRHTLNFSTNRAFFTINFSPGGGGGFTELARIPVSSAAVPVIYGNVVVGGPGYVPVTLPTTPTDQGVLQLVYNTTNGDPFHFSCADIRIATPAPPPPPPIDAIIEPGVLGDYFDVQVGTANRGTTPLTNLTNLFPEGLRITTAAYPVDRRADVVLISGPAPAIGGSLAPGERRDHRAVLEARSPGFAIAATRVNATGVGGVIHQDTALAEIEVARRVPTLLDIWTAMSGGMAVISDSALRDLEAARRRMTTGFYRSLPRWKLAFRDRIPNALERAVADYAGVDPRTFAAAPDNPKELFDLYWSYETARSAALAQSLRRNAGSAYTLAIKTPWEFWTNTNARASVGPELAAAALEASDVGNAYLAEAQSFWSNPAKQRDALDQIPLLANEARDGAKRLYSSALKVAERKATDFGRTMASDPKQAFAQLGTVEGTVQGEVAWAVLENVVGGKVLRGLKAVGNATKKAPPVSVTSHLDDLAPSAARPTRGPTDLGMTDEHAALIKREVVDPISAKHGVPIELQFRSTNPYSQTVRGAVGKVELITPKNVTPEDVMLGADARALGQAAVFSPRIPAAARRLPKPARDALELRARDRAAEWLKWQGRGARRDAKMELMKSAMKPGGRKASITSAGRTTTFEIEVGRTDYGKTVALTYKKLIVNGDTIVARRAKGLPIGSDYDGHAILGEATAKLLPAGRRSQIELEIMDGMRKLARDRGIPFGFHGFTHNAFDIGAKDYRKVFHYLLQTMSEADARRTAAAYAARLGTSPDEFLRKVAEFDQFVVKINTSGVSVGPGVIP